MAAGRVGGRGTPGTISQQSPKKLPSSLIIRHAAVHYVFLVNLYCAGIPDKITALATHTADGRTPDFVTHVYFIYCLPPSSLFL